MHLIWRRLASLCLPMGVLAIFTSQAEAHVKWFCGAVDVTRPPLALAAVLSPTLLVLGAASMTLVSAGGLLDTLALRRWPSLLRARAKIRDARGGTDPLRRGVLHAPALGQDRRGAVEHGRRGGGPDAGASGTSRLGRLAAARHRGHGRVSADLSARGAGNVRPVWDRGGRLRPVSHDGLHDLCRAGGLSRAQPPVLRSAPGLAAMAGPADRGDAGLQPDVDRHRKISLPRLGRHHPDRPSHHHLQLPRRHSSPWPRDSSSSAWPSICWWDAACCASTRRS